MMHATTFSCQHEREAAWILPPLAAPTAVDEANHRVANSLQMIAALLTIEARDVGDPVAAAILGRTRERIEAIGALHRRFTPARTHHRSTWRSIYRRWANRSNEAARSSAYHRHC